MLDEKDLRNGRKGFIEALSDLMSQTIEEAHLDPDNVTLKLRTDKIRNKITAYLSRFYNDEAVKAYNQICRQKKAITSSRSEYAFYFGLLDNSRRFLEELGSPSEEAHDTDELEETCIKLRGHIHRGLLPIVEDRFKAGFFADAVESAFKILEPRIKNICRENGYHDIADRLTGADLVRKAFGNGEQPKAIRLNNMSNSSECSIQEGYMHMFAGSFQAIRNPKAHEVIKIDSLRAELFLSVASLLMYTLDDAEEFMKSNPLNP